MPPISALLSSRFWTSRLRRNAITFKSLTRWSLRTQLVKGRPCESPTGTATSVLAAWSSPRSSLLTAELRIVLSIERFSSRTAESCSLSANTSSRSAAASASAMRYWATCALCGVVRCAALSK